MDQRQSLLGDSGSSISCENVSAFTFSTRGSFGFFTPPAYPVRSCPGLERLIQAVLPGKLSRPDPVPDGLSSSGLGPRADHPKAAALGAVSRSAYIIGTRPTSLSGLGLLHWDSGPEQTARTPRRRPSKSGQCHGHGPGHGGRPTSSGLGLLQPVSAYFIGTRAPPSEQTVRTRLPSESGHFKFPIGVMFQSRPGFQCRVGDAGAARSGPIMNCQCSHAHRPVGL